MDERQWIARILAGDTQSFSCLVAKYEQMAFTIAFRIIGNREEAEEATQDAFLKMYRALPDFHFESRFSTWFYRIVYRTALTALRQQRPTVDYEAYCTDLTTDELDSASAWLERKDRKKVVAQALKQLPSDESLLLTLFYLEECTIEEIHQITGYTETNVKTKLFRARKHLYVILKEKMNLQTADLL